MHSYTMSPGHPIVGPNCAGKAKNIDGDLQRFRLDFGAEYANYSEQFGDGSEHHMLYINYTMILYFKGEPTPASVKIAGPTSSGPSSGNPRSVTTSTTITFA